MWLFDSLKTRVKKWTDTVIDTTAKVWNFMEEKSATLMEKVPGWHDLKEKAAEYTEKAVDRVGTETKEMIKEWQGFIDSHIKKADTTTPETKAEVATPTVIAPENTIPATPVVAPVAETHESVTESTEKVEHHTHKKVVEKKTHTTKKAHTNKEK